MDCHKKGQWGIPAAISWLLNWQSRNSGVGRLLSLHQHGRGRRLCQGRTHEVPEFKADTCVGLTEILTEQPLGTFPRQCRK